VVESYERTLCKLTIGDEQTVGPGALDGKTDALVRLAALIAVDAASPSYLRPIEEALHEGATKDEIVGCLAAVLPAVGAARVVKAAPKLGLALGFDVHAALEDVGPRALPAR